MVHFCNKQRNQLKTFTWGSKFVLSLLPSFGSGATHWPKSITENTAMFIEQRQLLWLLPHLAIFSNYIMLSKFLLIQIEIYNNIIFI